MTILVESAIRVTLIAAIIALVLFAMRIKSASALHAVWASVVVLMLLLPAWVAWGPKASLPILPPDRTPVIALLPPPVTAELADATPHTRPVSTPAPSPARKGGGYVAIYLLGVGVFLLRLAIGTVRANRLTSASCVVPVTVGLLHPRIILPECSRDWPRAQLDAVLAHEGEHIRRRDPLVQWIALFNRAIFWFHPLAWWLERKLSGLAEEACDAAVIARGHDPREYSAYLLDLARSVERAGTRIDAVGMAMPGIGLKYRIRRMLSGVPAPRISRPRMTCTAAMCAGAAAILAVGTLSRAQSPPKFEVASIKPCKDGGDGRSGGGVGRSRWSPGRLSSQCETVANLIREAFLVFADGEDKRLLISERPMDRPIKGSPAWINSDLYSIEAKSEDTAGEAMMRGPMLQALLENRFQLRVHREIKEVPVYELTVAKGGAKLQAVPESCVPPGSTPPPAPGQPLPRSCGGFFASRNGFVTLHQTMASLCWNFSNMFDRDVIDKTGVAGTFDIDFEIDVQSLMAEVPQGATDPDSAAITEAFRAALPKLGLKLEPTKGAAEFLVIDRVEKPSEN